MMHKALHLRDDIDNMCQEKKEGKELPTLKIVWINQWGLKDNIKKNKESLITIANNSTENITEKEQKLRNRNKKKTIQVTNCQDCIQEDPDMAMKEKP